MLVTCRCTVCSLSTSRSAIAAVREALGEQREHLALARRQLRAAAARPGRRARAAARAPSRPPVRRPRARPSAARLAASASRAWAASNGAPLRVKVSTASSSSTRARSWSPRAAASVALGDVGARAQRRRPHLALDLAQRGQRRRGSVEVAARGARPHEQLQRRRPRQPAVLGHVAQQPLDQLGGLLRVAAVERHPRQAQLPARGALGPLAQPRGLAGPPLAAAQLGQAGERAADHPRPRLHEVLDRGLEHRLGDAPAPAPQVHGAVLGAAVGEHHAAAVALGELGDPVAPLRRAPVVEHRGAGGDEEAERPGARHRVRGPALERRRGRLVEPAHALVDARAGDQRRALEREPEHLEVGHAEPAAELGRRVRASSPARAVSPLAWAM